MSDNKNKIMDFTAFSKENSLQEPKTALKGDNVDPGKKESFVDQVKYADLTQLNVNQPDYSKTQKIDENEQAAALVSDITAIERQILDLQTRLQSQKEALQQIVNTTTTTTAAVNPTVTNPAQTATPATTPVPTVAAAVPAASPAV
jgi:hypothetical protein